jgi:transposase
MGNVLEPTKQQQILALAQLGWPVSRVATAIGVDRETVTRYVRAARLPVRRRGRPSEAPAKPAISSGVSTDPPAPPAMVRGEVSTDARPSRAPQASACQPYRDQIEAALKVGRNAMAIWQDLVDEVGFPGRYASVRRFVQRRRGTAAPEARVVIVTTAGEDYGESPVMVSPAADTQARPGAMVVRTAVSFP